MTLHEQGKPGRRFTASVPSSQVRFSTDDANLRIGESRVDVLANGRYRVHAQAREDAGGAPLALDLEVAPFPGAYFPGASVAAGIVSGYVVPGLRAERHRLALRQRIVHVVRQRAGLSRPQLGRVARRVVGVGRGACRRVHAAVRARRATGQRGRADAVVRLSRGHVRLPRRVSSARHSLCGRPHHARGQRDDSYAIHGGARGHSWRGHAAPHAHDRGCRGDRHATYRGGAR